MKLVIKIGSTTVTRRESLQRMAEAVAHLLAEGHRITLVHGGSHGHGAACNGITSPCQPGVTTVAETRGIKASFEINKLLVAILCANRVSAFGLCGADGNILRVRSIRNQAGTKVEVVSVETFWLDVITQHRAVPVIGDIGLFSDGECYSLHSDQLAGACAAGWNADALVFITGAEGARNPDGTIIRWLETEQIVELARDRTLSDGLATKLKVCREALRHGVKRALIFPLSKIDSLDLFYFSRIDFGTEVILPISNQGDLNGRSH